MAKHIPGEEEIRANIEDLARTDGRYAPEAFYLVNDSVAAAQKWLRSGEMAPQDTGASRCADKNTFHVSGYEVLEAFRRLAREHWGCMARQVLRRWGVFRTEDVGQIVYLMVNDKRMGWTSRETDTIEEFSNVFDFKDAFDAW